MGEIENIVILWTIVGSWMAGGGENSRRVKLKFLLVSGIHSFNVAQLVPRCLLECVCRGLDGGSVVVDRCRRSEWVLKLALSNNVAVHWAVKVDLWISSKNRPIVDIKRWVCKGVYVCLFMRVYFCDTFVFIHACVYVCFINACLFLCSFMRVYICVHLCVYICVNVDR